MIKPSIPLANDSLIQIKRSLLSVGSPPRIEIGKLGIKACNSEILTEPLGL